MEAKKSLGIWMDHSTAKFIDLNAERNFRSIDSKFTFFTKEKALNKSENLMHNKRQQMHEAFYKQIAEKILNYDHVLLFGPTDAKAQLHNYMNKDLHFKDIQFDIEAADKMTKKEKIAFVKRHFEG